MKNLIYFPFLLQLLFFCTLSFPSNGQWKFIGSPENGITYKTFAKGDTLLLATEAGIFYSDDSAESWKPIPVPDSLIVFREVWHDRQSLYLATIKVISPYAHTYLLYRSDDWGISWINITQNIDLQNICRSIYLSNDTIIWFGRYETLISFDRGESYTPTGTSQSRVISTFTLDDTLYVFTVEGLIRSHDLATPWETVYTEPNGIYTSSLNSIGTSLWKVDMIWPIDTSIISRSFDRGKTWESIISLPMQSSNHTKVVGDKDHLFLVSDHNDLFYYSGDDGVTWEPFAVPETVYSTMYHDGLLLLNTAHGVYKSTDNGITLPKSNKGLEASSVFQIKHSWSALWVDDYSYVFKKPDGSDEWNSVESLKNLQISIDGHFAAFHNGIPSISSDGGNTWIPIPGNEIPSGYTVESNGFRVSGNVFFLNTNKRALFSRDFGITWEIFNTSDPNSWGIRNAYYHDKHLVIGGHDDLFVSDDGASWEKINYNLDDFNATTFVTFYYLAPYFFACGDGRYYRLHQDSIQWIELNAPVPGDIFEFSPFSRVCNYNSYGNILLTTFYQRGIFLSRDYGITWENITDGLQDLQTIVLYINEPDLFVGVDGGVWKRSLSDFNFTSISEAENNLSFSVSPLPSNDLLKITIQDPAILSNVHLVLYNSNGSLIKSQKITSPKYIQMDIHEIPSGIYILTLQDGEHRGSIKIVKQ